jgi:hypothetical protein
MEGGKEVDVRSSRGQKGENKLVAVLICSFISRLSMRRATEWRKIKNLNYDKTWRIYFAS